MRLLLLRKLLKCDSIFDMKISIITLGCKVNSYESDSLRLALKNLGHEVFDDFVPADIYIINTCAVTNEAERKSRQMVAKCRKLNPNAKIIITGCASQKNSEQFRNLEGVTLISGVKNKLALIDELDLCDTIVTPLDEKYDECYFPEPSHTRAYVKIQDGCNNFCSYCIIPYLRGRSRSRDIVEIMNEVQALSEHAKEIVITGIDITDYKIEGKRALPILLKNLESNNYRVRLGSIENTLIDDDFIKSLKEISNLCPHFHLSLQSGCDAILKKMNRHYTAEQFYKRVKMLRRVIKNPAITTDIIVGFPQETEEMFWKTVKFVKKVGFASIHVFPYSKREGTVASRMRDQIPNSEKSKRVEILQAVGAKLHEKYIKKSRRGKHQLLVESVDGGYAWGYTENYIRCKIHDDGYSSNQMLRVKITRIEDGVAVCKKA